MSVQPQPEVSRAIQIAPYWSSAYFFCVAVLFLWGYWSPFGINVLEYVSLADVIKTAAYPLASAFVFVAIGVVAGEVFFPNGLLPASGGQDSALGRFLRRFSPEIVAAYFLGIALLFTLGPTRKWLVLPALLAMPMAIGLKSLGALQFLQSDAIRSMSLFMLAALPPFAYGQGVIRADDILTGQKYSYVVQSLESAPVPVSAPPSDRPRFIGKAGESVFFYLPLSRSILLVPQAQIKALELSRYGTEGAKAPPAVSSASQASSPASKQ
jgi:hypothetical protein